jgi:hypothetical protein
MARCTVPLQVQSCTDCSISPLGAPCADAPLLWHAQPPPEDDPHQEARWSDDQDRIAFYALYEKLLNNR